jgi:MarR family transcriptional regulator, 2-MHQ and catechol-resistance regulon repressor
MYMAFDPHLAAPDSSARPPNVGRMTIDPGEPLRIEDPLAHRALDALLRAEASVMRRLAAELERAGVSATGFAMLVLLTSAGGGMELRALRRRLRLSKATATEVLDTLERRGFARRARLQSDRRAVLVILSEPGRTLVTHAFPAHAERVRETFDVLDEREKRQLAELCRKLDRAA